MFHQTILTYTLMIVSLKSGYVFAGLTEKEFDDMMNATYDAVEECLEKYDINSSEADKMYTDPDFNYDPRFLSCFFTECGIMEKGVYNVEKFMNFTKRYLHREDELAESYKIRQLCLQVNEAKVSDGEVGYGERAMLLYNCLNDNGDHFISAEE